MPNLLRDAPPLQVAQWFNTPAPLSLEALRGKVVVLEAFQMLCPGCVSHGRLRQQHFGQIGDVQLGAQIASLLHEADAA